MLTPEEEARLRDAWCVELLERTSSGTALGRVHAEERDGTPAYDTVPARFTLRERVQPRDLIVCCARCGCVVVAGPRQRFCSKNCRNRAAWRRWREQHAAASVA